MNANEKPRRGLLSRETKKTAKDVVSWTAAALLPLWSQQPAAEDGWFELDNRFHSRLWNGKRQQGCRSPKELAKSTKRLPQLPSQPQRPAWDVVLDKSHSNAAFIIEFARPFEDTVGLTTPGTKDPE